MLSQGGGAATVVIIRNPQTLPDAELVLHPGKKLAEFTLVDADREGWRAGRDLCRPHTRLPPRAATLRLNCHEVKPGISQ